MGYSRTGRQPASCWYICGANEIGYALSIKNERFMLKHGNITALPGRQTKVEHCARSGCISYFDHFLLFFAKGPRYAVDGLTTKSSVKTDAKSHAAP